MLELLEYAVQFTKFLYTGPQRRLKSRTNCYSQSCTNIKEILIKIVDPRGNAVAALFFFLYKEHH